MAKPMTLVKVLRTFAVSDDGIRTRPMIAGESGFVPSDLMPGLVAEGYVVAATEAAPIAPPASDPEPVAASGCVAIPEDWRSLHHKQVVKIAKAIDPTAGNLAAATAAIETYLAAGGE